MPIHPTMTNQEVEFICDAIKLVAENYKEWTTDYRFDSLSNEFIHLEAKSVEHELVSTWFNTEK